MAARLDRELRSRSAAAHVPGPRGPRAARGDAAARDQGAERRHLLPAVDDLGNAPQRPLVARRHPAQPARHGGAAALLGQAGRPAGLGPAAPPRSAARRSGVEAPRPGRIRRFSLRPVDLAALSLPDLASDRASGCGGRREEARRPPAAGRQPVREGRVRPRRQVPPEPASPAPAARRARGSELRPGPGQGRQGAGLRLGRLLRDRGERLEGPRWDRDRAAAGAGGLLRADGARRGQAGSAGAGIPRAGRAADRRAPERRARRAPLPAQARVRRVVPRAQPGAAAHLGDDPRRLPARPLGVRLSRSVHGLEAGLGTGLEDSHLAHHLPSDAGRTAGARSALHGLAGGARAGRALAAARQLADELGVPLVEDCALALLSRNGDRPLGSTGDLSVFCLYKTLPVPNGGALLARGRFRDELYRLAEVEPPGWASTASHLAGSLLSNLELRTGPLGRRVRDAVRGAGRRLVRLAGVERVSTGTQHFDPAAVKLGMSALSHLVLRNQDWPLIVERRRRNYFLLYAALRDVAPPVTGELKPGVCPLFYPMPVRDKAAAMARLLARGVEPVDFWRLRQPEVQQGDFPEVDRLRETVLELPVHQDLSPADAEHVASCVRELLP